MSLTTGPPATGPAGGYFGRALVVDVTDGSAATLPLPDAVLRAYLGGAGLGTWLLHRLGKGPQQRDLAGRPTLPVPYDQGGRTDACNAGARSRRCHQVKQSKGWTVTQPRPGWHVWTTPTGRTYTQEPWRYIA